MKIKLRKESIAASALVIILLLILLARYVVMEVSSKEITVQASGISFENKEKGVLKVHICGEVNIPGVYELSEGDRINDLVILAGGTTELADIRSINLAKILADEDKITIYAINSKGDEVKYIGVDIFNYGTKETLLEIDGIGEVLAKRIIDYREKNNSFSSYRDLLLVEGIGEGKLNTIIGTLENN